MGKHEVDMSETIFFGLFCFPNGKLQMLCLTDSS